MMMHKFCGLLIIGVLLSASIEAQECPPPGESFGLCVEACSSNSNCTGEQLCCSNGCGRQCMLPVEDPCANVSCAAPECSDLAAGTITPEGQCCAVCACAATDGTMVAAGTSFMNDCNTCSCGSTGVAGCTRRACPPTTEPTAATPTITDANTLPTSSPTVMCPNATNLIGTCDERCSSDDQCTNGQLCCSHGCGHSCMDPVVDCAAVSCLRPSCQSPAVLFTPEGSCCAVCGCPTPNGDAVAPGETYHPDSCNTCTCGQNGLAACTLAFCPPPTDSTPTTDQSTATPSVGPTDPTCPVGGQIRMECAAQCSATCANMNSVSVCPLVCVVNGCECPIGTVIDEQSNNCVAPSDCPTTDCPVEGQVRIPCASPCSVTCANMDDVLICPTVCVTDGCQCVNGTVIDEQSNTCVARSDCPTGRTQTCPTVQRTDEENCVDECSSDDDCQYDRICCSNGCGGHTCSDSVEMCELVFCDWPICEDGAQPEYSPFSCCPYCPTTPPPRPTGCTASDGTSVDVGETYMDQCNTCRCLEGGVGACTKMACIGCTLADGNWVAIGDTYKKDCNTCTCTDQDVDICTEIACVKPGDQDTLDGGTGSGTILFAGLITTLLCGLLSVFL